MMKTFMSHQCVLNYNPCFQFMSLDLTILQFDFNWAIISVISRRIILIILDSLMPGNILLFVRNC